MRSYTLKYLGAKCQGVCNLLSNGSAKNEKGKRDQAMGKRQQVVNGGEVCMCSFDSFFNFPVGLKD